MNHHNKSIVIKNITSQLISLLKNIYINKPNIKIHSELGFFAGQKKNSSHGMTGIIIKWWFTELAHTNNKNIAFQIIDFYEEFNFLDLDDIYESVSDTLKEICIDENFFDFDEVLKLKKDTLFECRAEKNIEKFGLIIHNEIIARILRLYTQWCNIYVVPRVTGKSFSINEMGLSVINRADKNSWQQVTMNGYYFAGWTPKDEKFCMTKTRYEYLIVSEQNGTQSGSMFESTLKFRLLLSIMFSIINTNNKHQIHKSAAQPYVQCAQFPKKTDVTNTVTYCECGALLPYYANKNIVFSENMVKELIDWFNDFKTLSIEYFNRVQMCAHFINRAMNTNEIESFINYFISLDSLFGIKGSVEKSIINGVNSLNVDTSWQHKFSYLYKLRNELVHGGSRHFKEWSHYRKYIEHFGSRPEKDIEALSFISLKQAPFLFLNK